AKKVLSREQVSAKHFTLFTNAGERTPEGVQSPLWTVYAFFARAGETSPPSPRLRSGGATETVIVSRQLDSFNWFSDRHPGHERVPATKYVASLETLFADSGRSWRISAMAP